jgi:SRSO17 transposase
MIFPRCPRPLQAFFGPLRRYVQPASRFRRLWCLLLAWVAHPAAQKLRHLAAAARHHHRTSCAAFLQHADQDATDLLGLQARQLLRSLRPRPGEVLELLIDDTRIAKRGKEMEHLSKLWDHKQQRFVTGHLVVCAAWRFRGVVIPWRFVLWRPKASAGRHYRKTTQIAADLVREMPEVPGLRVRVLFDAFYLCPAVTGACAARGFTWFSVAASNRALLTPRGERRKLADWAPGWLRHHGRRVRMRRARGWAWMRIAGLRAELSRIGEVRLVLSKRPRDPWKNLVVVATNEVTLKDRDVLAVYEARWWVEVLLKELRGPLGLDQYQVRTEKKITTHLHLSGLAHQLLTHHSLQVVGAQAKQTTKEGRPLPPLNQRLADLREALRRERVEAAVGRIRHAKVRQKVKQVLLELSEAA